MNPNWSAYQIDIFNAVANSNESILVEAVAGSGKTTTIVEAINHVPRAQSVCFLAFNKAIAEELKRRVTAPNAKCLTLHAAGWQAWRQHLAWDAGGCKVDGEKMYEVVRDTLTWDERKDFPGTQRLVALAKMAGIVPRDVVTTQEDGSHYTGLVEDTDDAWMDLVDHYGLDPDEVSMELARRVLAASIDAARDVVDFDDMLYMPVVAGASFERYDVVFLDEAQDVSGIQMEMVRRMAASATSRVIAVGDRHQAIYGFRGAHAGSMDAIKELFDASELPLSVTYRCPRAVVTWAQQWVPQLEAWEGASDGKLAHTGTFCQDCGATPTDEQREYCLDCKCGGRWREWELEDYKPGDAILCRINRPLVGMTFALIRAKIPAKMLGRDIGAGLVKLANKLGKTVAGSGEETFREAFSRRLDNYRRAEAERLSRRRQDRATLASMHDRLDTLQVFVDQPDAVDLRALVRSIEALFGDNGQLRECVILSTVHKFKGREADRVFIVDAHKWMPGPWASEGWEMDQERNLQYVAATRAKRELWYVKSLEGG